jgi:AAA domain
MNALASPVFDVAEVSRALALLHPAGHTFELRVPDARFVCYNGRPDSRMNTAFGFFDSAEAAVAVLPALEAAEWPAIYVSLNPVTPSLIARASNQIKPASRKSASTSDHDVERRTALLIDLDPVRPAGISSTDEEHAAALARATEIRGRLCELGWPEPIVADSGNGAHLVYRLDLPADDGGLVKDFLVVLADAFDDKRVHIDKTVFNAARIVKLWGTAARKGDSTPDRPHRMSKLLSVPAEWNLVTEEMLRETTAALRPAPKASAKPPASRVGSFDVRDFIARHFPDADERTWSSGTRWILVSCPFNADHTGTSAALMESTSGVLSFKCQHNGCAGLEWKDLREKYEPKPAKSAPAWREDPPEGTPAQAVAITAEELLSRAFPLRVNLLSPWLAEKSLGMIFSLRGVGKTWFTLSTALAVASGREMFRGWRANEPACVLHVDGEMPAERLRERVAHLVAGGGYETDGRLRLLASDLQPSGLPTLTSAPGQRIVEDQIGDAKLLIFDNISTLFPGLDENDAGAWDPVQAWLLSLRRRGLAVLLAHHAGKGGQQRGTSKHEDALDVSIKLCVPENHEAEDGCRFEVVFEKARGLMGRAVAKFEAELMVRAGRATWNVREVSDEKTAQIVELSNSGLSLRTIAAKVGLDASNVQRRLARAKRLAERPVDERGVA